MIYYIYTLAHPTTNNEIRYVGKTINLNRRYKQHLYDKRTSHKASWVKSLKNQGLKPILTVIEECTEHNWEDREKCWITQFDNLTNLYDGGGTHYVPTTKEDTKAKISKIHKGKVLTDTQKSNISKAMKKRACVVNGVEYISISEASRQLNITVGLLDYRIRSVKYPEYTWVL